MSFLASSSAWNKSSLTSYSTGLDPAGWREFWRVHGTSWRSLIDLHFEICDRLRASSSSWRSS
jgi:hypothetical protein